jgi:hypothetical protein
MMTKEKETISRFVKQAEAFCDFVDAAASLSLNERLFEARQKLTDLLGEAFKLPEGDGEASDPGENIALPSDWPGFGEYDYYFEVFDPYKLEEPVTGHLSDDIFDIYRDLKRGLVAYNRGETGAAVWEWRFHFEIHWGDHAVDALRALQRACVRIDRESID